MAGKMTGSGIREERPAVTRLWLGISGLREGGYRHKRWQHGYGNGEKMIVMGSRTGEEGSNDT